MGRRSRVGIALLLLFRHHAFRNLHDVRVDRTQAFLADVDHRGHIDHAGALFLWSNGPVHKIIGLTVVKATHLYQGRTNHHLVEHMASRAVGREKLLPIGSSCGHRKRGSESQRYLLHS